MRQTIDISTSVVDFLIFEQGNGMTEDINFKIYISPGTAIIMNKEQLKDLHRTITNQLKW